MDRSGHRGRDDLTASAAVGSRRPEWLTAVTVTLASLAAPLHFDETFWVSIARMVFRDGRTLYVTAIDNKSPVVYLVSGLLDALPGPFFVARALFVGLLAWLLVRALGALGVSPIPCTVAVAAASLASGLVLSTELPAAMALAWGFVFVRRKRPWAAVGLVAAAALIDPRSVLIGSIVASLLLATKRRAARMPLLVLTGSGIGVAAAVISNENLRYGLIELNLASRGALGGPAAADVFAAAVVVLLPILVLTWSLKGMQRIGWILLTASAVLALLSVNPFPHYWVYAVLAVPYLNHDRRLHRPELAIIVLALAPLAATIGTDAITQARVVADHRAAAEALATIVDQDETFVQFALVPYPYFFSGREIGLDAPGIHYLTWETSRTAAHFDRLVDAIREADAIVDDGGLRTPASDLNAIFWSVQSVFQSPTLSDFSCAATFGPITVWTRTSC